MNVIRKIAISSLRIAYVGVIFIVELLICALTDWGYPANTYALYACIAFGTLLFAPVLASSLRPSARQLYCVWVLLITLFFALPSERRDFAYRFNTIQPGMTVQEVEQRLAPYRKRSERLSGQSSFGLKSSAPIAPRYSGTVCYTWTTESEDEWGIINVEKGIVQSTSWYVD